MTHSTGPRMAAGEALAAAVRDALAGVDGLNGCYDGPPVQAAFPYATVEAGAESDWSHKTGAGREVRLAVTLSDAGERPARLRQLAATAEAALAGVAATGHGWRLVSFRFLRSRLVPERLGQWASVADYRARLLAE